MACFLYPIGHYTGIALSSLNSDAWAPMAQDSSFRGLVTLGIGAVGGTAVAAFTANDSELSKATVEVRPAVRAL